MFIKISNLSPIHFVSKIRHKHQCNRKIVGQMVQSQKHENCISILYFRLSTSVVLNRIQLASRLQQENESYYMTHDDVFGRPSVDSFGFTDCLIQGKSMICYGNISVRHFSVIMDQSKSLCKHFGTLFRVAFH